MKPKTKQFGKKPVKSVDFDEVSTVVDPTNYWPPEDEITKPVFDGGKNGSL